MRGGGRDGIHALNLSLRCVGKARFRQNQKKGGKGDVLTVESKLFAKSNLKFLQHIEWKADFLKVVIFPTDYKCREQHPPHPLFRQLDNLHSSEGKTNQTSTVLQVSHTTKVVFLSCFLRQCFAFSCIYLASLFSQEILCSHTDLKIRMTNLSFRLVAS